MPKLPSISGEEAARAFQRAGWEVARQRGSHVVFGQGGFGLHPFYPYA
jgi:predicted RNA binding protein YcfA (HicA-like mRNA interferase family)